MKAYRKKLIGMMMAMMFCFSPVNVVAAELPVTISSGLDMNTEEVEYTFEDARIVYGEAAPGTEVVFTVSRMNRFGKLVEQHRQEVKVGSMGLFSVTLPLERGNNYIDMEAGGKTEQAIVKQVPKTVKTQLKRMIALPGLNVNL